MVSCELCSHFLCRDAIPAHPTLVARRGYDCSLRHAALAQKDLKRILAYSSINHLGYCMLGIFSVAIITGNGSAFAMDKVAALKA